jgi:hypothetical protein
LPLRTDLVLAYARSRPLNVKVVRQTSEAGLPSPILASHRLGPQCLIVMSMGGVMSVAVHPVDALLAHDRQGCHGALGDDLTEGLAHLLQLHR